jgi:hypothetical protein
MASDRASITVRAETRDLIRKIAKSRGISIPDVLHEAVSLYDQAVATIGHDVRASDECPDFSAMPKDEAIIAEKAWLHENGLVKISRASVEFLDRSPSALRLWEENGILRYKDGTDIPIYRSIHGLSERWYSPQNLWDIVRAATRARIYSKPDAEAALLRIQQLFIEQQARRNVAKMRREKQ